MKKSSFKLLILSLLPLVSGFSDEENYESYSYWDFHPLHAGGNAIWIAKADLSEDEPGEVRFNKECVFISMIVPISRTSFFIPKVEWNSFSFDWDRNPKFHETRFNYIQYALTFYSNALEKWRWIVRADYNMDIAHTSTKYGLFSTLAWGAYELHRKWHYHVGFLTYTGLRGGWVYPLIGLDWAPNKKWRFQIVFPVDYSVEYTINKNWRLSMKGRPLRERFRVGPNEPQPRSIFNYSSIGTEFNVHYERFLRFQAELFAGYNWGGTLYIKNKLGKNAFYTDFGSAAYVGALIDYGF